MEESSRDGHWADELDSQDYAQCKQQWHGIILMTNIHLLSQVYNWPKSSAPALSNNETTHCCVLLLLDSGRLCSSGWSDLYWMHIQILISGIWSYFNQHCWNWSPMSCNGLFIVITCHHFVSNSTISILKYISWRPSWTKHISRRPPEQSRIAFGVYSLMSPNNWYGIMVSEGALLLLGRTHYGRFDLNCLYCGVAKLQIHWEKSLNQILLQDKCINLD